MYCFFLLLCTLLVLCWCSLNLTLANYTPNILAFSNDHVNYFKVNINCKLNSGVSLKYLCVQLTI